MDTMDNVMETLLKSINKQAQEVERLKDLNDRRTQSEIVLNLCKAAGSLIESSSFIQGMADDMGEPFYDDGY